MNKQPDVNDNNDGQFPLTDLLAADDASERPLDLIVMHKIERYLRQLAPHQKEREGPQLLRDAVTAMDGMAKYSQHLQAKIDSLMLEYCPDEMTPEQIAEWGRYQQAVHNEPAKRRAESASSD